jgi:hypothetical protein
MNTEAYHEKEVILQNLESGQQIFTYNKNNYHCEKIRDTYYKVFCNEGAYPVCGYYPKEHKLGVAYTITVIEEELYDITDREVYYVTKGWDAVVSIPVNTFKRVFIPFDNVDMTRESVELTAMWYYRNAVEKYKPFNRQLK